MKVYHITKAENASAIAAHGFREETGMYLTRSDHVGVWVSDRPLVVESGIHRANAACFEIEIPEEELARYECIEEGKRYREFLLPADLVNRFDRRRLSEDELASVPW